MRDKLALPLIISAIILATILFFLDEPAYLLYSIILLCIPVFFVILKNPELGAYLWIFFLPVQIGATQQYLGFKFAISDIFIAMLVPVLFFKRLRERQDYSSKMSLLPYLAALFMIFTLSMLRTLQFIGYIPHYALINKYVGYVFLMVTFYVLYLILGRDIEKVHTSIKMLLISSFVFNVISILSSVLNFLFGIPSYFLYYKIIVNGLLFNPNAYGCFLLAVFMIQFSLLATKKYILPRYFMWANSIICFIAILLTLSRSTWLGFIVGITVLLFYNKHLIKRILLTSIMGIFSILLFFGTDVIQTFVSLSLRSSTILLRMEIMRRAWAYFLNNPLLGIGLGSFLELSAQFLAVKKIIHNTYFWILVETGVVGFVLFAALLFKITKNLLVAINSIAREKPLVIGIFASFAAILGFMIGVEGFYQRIFWFVIALSEVFYSFSIMKKR